MTNSTDVSDMKMTRFGYRFDLIRERHVRVKDEAKIASRGTDFRMISLLRDKLVRSDFAETLLFCANEKKFSF